MKRIFLIMAVMLTSFSAMTNAQAPNSFDFQSLVRDASGKFMKSQSVGVRISILQGSISGSAVYTETHAVSTNANGLLTLTIGQGTTSDNFSAINWSAGPYFIKTEMDLSGGTDYALSTVTQMMSVPYALYANSAGDYEARLAALEARADAMETTMASVPTYHADGFSIAPNRQVKFAKGNLCYNYSTKKYAFATNQYTFSIDYTSLKNGSGTTYVFRQNRYNGLYNTDNQDFLSNSTNTQYDIAYYAKADIGNGWFTPAAEHWNYLIYMRTNASKLYGRATVNGVAGLIILPDGWVLPSGLTFKPAQSSWTANNYTIAQWSQMESAGAVFLPNTTNTETLSNTSQYNKVGAKGYRCSTTMQQYKTYNNNLLKFSANSNCQFEFVRSYCTLITSLDNQTNAVVDGGLLTQVRLVKDY